MTKDYVQLSVMYQCTIVPLRKSILYPEKEIIDIYYIIIIYYNI